MQLEFVRELGIVALEVRVLVVVVDDYRRRRGDRDVGVEVLPLRVPEGVLHALVEENGRDEGGAALDDPVEIPAALQGRHRTAEHTARDEVLDVVVEGVAGIHALESVGAPVGLLVLVRELALVVHLELVPLAVHGHRLQRYAPAVDALRQVHGGTVVEVRPLVQCHGLRRVVEGEVEAQHLREREEILRGGVAGAEEHPLRDGCAATHCGRGGDVYGVGLRAVADVYLRRRHRREGVVSVDWGKKARIAGGGRLDVVGIPVDRPSLHHLKTHLVEVVAFEVHLYVPRQFHRRRVHRVDGPDVPARRVELVLRVGVLPAVSEE